MYFKLLASKEGKRYFIQFFSVGVLLTAIAAAFIVSAVTIGVVKYKSINSYAFESPIVIVDAGHGGFDGGAVVGEIFEKDINLKISRALAVMLKSAGITVIETRTDDTSTESNPNTSISSRKKSDLQNRLDLTKSYPDAIYVSIHLNKFSSSTAKGAQIFYGPKNENSSILAENIRSSIVSSLQKENTRALKKGTKDTYLLYNSPLPTVIVECGFMSNPKELNILLEDNYQQKMAFLIFNGIIDYLN